MSADNLSAVSGQLVRTPRTTPDTLRYKVRNSLILNGGHFAIQSFRTLLPDTLNPLEQNACKMFNRKAFNCADKVSVLLSAVTRTDTGPPFRGPVRPQCPGKK